MILNVPVIRSALLPAAVLGLSLLLGACGGDSSNDKNAATGVDVYTVPGFPDADVYGRYQRVMMANASQAGTEFSYPLYYNVMPSWQHLAGVSFRVHWNSQALTFNGLDKTLEDGWLGGGVVQNDSSNYDGDDSTDKYTVLSWGSFPSGQWPATVSSAVLLSVLQFSAQQEGTSYVRFSSSATAAGYGFFSQSFAMTYATTGQTSTGK